MSDDKDFGEVEDKVVLSSSDCDGIRNYGSHFNIDVPDSLKAVLDNFESTPDLESQNAIRVELCRWMCTSQHASFLDPIWEEPKKHAKEIIFDTVFNKELDKVLNGEEL